MLNEIELNQTTPKKILVEVVLSGRSTDLQTLSNLPEFQSIDFQAHETNKKISPTYLATVADQVMKTPSHENIKNLVALFSFFPTLTLSDVSTCVGKLKTLKQSESVYLHQFQNQYIWNRWMQLIFRLFESYIIVKDLQAGIVTEIYFHLVRLITPFQIPRSTSSNTLLSKKFAPGPVLPLNRPKPTRTISF